RADSPRKVLALRRLAIMVSTQGIDSCIVATIPAVSTPEEPMRNVRVAPKGMGLNDFVAEAEGFFAAEGIEVEWDIKTSRGTQSRWTENKYLQRPQDKPYTEAKDASLIQCACLWGTIS